MKYLTTLLCTVIIAYLLVSFINASFNLFNWSISDRAFTVVASLIISGMIRLIRYLNGSIDD